MKEAEQKVFCFWFNVMFKDFFPVHFINAKVAYDDDKTDPHIVLTIGDRCVWFNAEGFADESQTIKKWEIKKINGKNEKNEKNEKKEIVVIDHFYDDLDFFWNE
jgi:hypothetical protein